MNLKFSLNASQLRNIREEGIEPIMCGPVAGTKDMYHLEVEPSSTPKLLAAFFHWGKKVGRGVITAKVIPMYELRRKTAHQ